MVNPAIAVDKLRIIMTFNGSLVDRAVKSNSCLAVTLDTATKFLDWNRRPGALRKPCGYSVLDANNALKLVNVPLTGNYWPYYAPPIDLTAESGSLLNPVRISDHIGAGL